MGIESMNRLTLCLVALGVLCAAGRAEAGSLYEFSFTYSSSSLGVSGSGFLYGTENADGSFTLTSGSGTSTEAGALTLEPAGTYINTLPPSVNLTSDNLLFPTSNPVLDGGGIVFLAAGAPTDSQYINIFGNGPDNYTYFNNYAGPYPAVNGPVSFSVTEIGSVPEPASIVSATIGILCVASFTLARNRKIASV
jgi:hypothetical protein